MTRPSLAAAAAALAAATVISGVTGGCQSSKSPPTVAPVTAGTSATYVAVGASESVGVGADRPVVEGWPNVLYRTTMSRGTEFYAVAVSGSTTAEALRTQVPLALDLKPTLVTVWLNVNDLIAGVPAASYEKDLSALVRDLRRGGATQVLVANTPPVENLPALARFFGSRDQRDNAQIITRPNTPPVASSSVVQALVRARVDEYNEVIARVVAAQGAILVDLHAAGLAARAKGIEASLISRDGFHPSTAGHAAVAASFAASLPKNLRTGRV